MKAASKSQGPNRWRIEEHLGRAAEGATLWWSGRVPVTALTTKVEELIMLEIVAPVLGTCWDVPELDLLRFINWLAFGIPGNIESQTWQVIIKTRQNRNYLYKQNNKITNHWNNKT